MEIRSLWITIPRPRSETICACSIQSMPSCASLQVCCWPPKFALHIIKSSQKTPCPVASNCWEPCGSFQTSDTLTPISKRNFKELAKFRRASLKVRNSSNQDDWAMPLLGISMLSAISSGHNFSYTHPPQSTLSTVFMFV